MPDVYQGTEFWDESLVDPDNRRPVDYAARRAALARNAEPAGLLADWASGTVKQALIHRLLLARAEAPALFTAGHYTPLPLEGAQAGAMLAFLRQEAGEALLVAVPRLSVPLLGRGETLSVPDTVWGDTRLVLPPALSGRSWRCLLTGASVPAGDALPLAGHPLPLRVLRAAG
ncbi:hypothetical protein [Teichococcus aestuarii]|uniref:hypothetical protein n=1 Tax=Teichococcus aestuarii TaxID=568898 RepID=UPI0036198619